MPPGSAAAKNILIVDDDAVSRRLARAVLEGAGYSVTEAGTVYAALQIAAANAPHLVLLDLMMPVQDGFAFLAERRVNPKLARVPVLVFSGENQIEAVHRATAEGADGFLAKPLEAALLLRKARKLLRDRQFLAIELGPDAPKVTVTLPAIIVSANTSQLAVTVSARIAPESDVLGGVRLRGWELLTNVGASFDQVKRSRRPARSIGPARYVTTFNLVGLTREQLESLDKLLGTGL